MGFFSDLFGSTDPMKNTTHKDKQKVESLFGTVKNTKANDKPQGSVARDRWGAVNEAPRQTDWW